MTVRQMDRRQSPLLILQKVDELCVEMDKAVVRENFLPKKIRNIHAQRLVKSCITIRDLTVYANSIYPPNEERLKIQKELLFRIKSLSQSIDDLVKSGTCQKPPILLIQTIKSCRDTAIAWHKADLTRVNELHDQQEAK